MVAARQMDQRQASRSLGIILKRGPEKPRRGPCPGDSSEAFTILPGRPATSLTLSLPSLITPCPGRQHLHQVRLVCYKSSLLLILQISGMLTELCTEPLPLPYKAQPHPPSPQGAEDRRKHPPPPFPEQLRVLVTADPALGHSLRTCPSGSLSSPDHARPSSLGSTPTSQPGQI